METTFHVTYKTDDGKPGKGTICGPKGKGVLDCIKIVKLAASKYSILPETVKAVRIPERDSCGFLYPLQALTPEGQTATITRWFF